MNALFPRRGRSHHYDSHEPHRVRRRRMAALVAAGALASSSADAPPPKTDPRDAPRAARLAPSVPGSSTPRRRPPPEGTIRPKPGSWDAVRPPRGYRVVLLTAGDDHPTTTLVTGVKQWAKAEHVTLETVAATTPERLCGRDCRGNGSDGPTLSSAPAMRSSTPWRWSPRVTSISSSSSSAPNCPSPP